MLRTSFQFSPLICEYPAASPPNESVRRDSAPGRGQFRRRSQAGDKVGGAGRLRSNLFQNSKLLWRHTNRTRRTMRARPALGRRTSHVALRRVIGCRCLVLRMSIVSTVSIVRSGGSLRRNPGMRKGTRRRARKSGGPDKEHSKHSASEGHLRSVYTIRGCRCSGWRYDMASHFSRATNYRGDVNR